MYNLYPFNHYNVNKQVANYYPANHLFCQYTIIYIQPPHLSFISWTFPKLSLEIIYSGYYQILRADLAQPLPGGQYHFPPRTCTGSVWHQPGSLVLFFNPSLSGLLCALLCASQPRMFHEILTGLQIFITSISFLYYINKYMTTWTEVWRSTEAAET